MQEIIIIGVGQCGIGIASEFIQQLNYDHCLDNNNKIIDQERFNKKLNVFYKETREQVYFPRALFVDLDTRQVDKIRIQKDFVIDPNSCFSSKVGSLNNCAVGKYTDGAILFDICEDQLRKLFEGSDQIQGIILFHSTGGGTGSGLTYKFIQYFRETDLTKIVHCNTVFPRGDENNPLPVYNTALIMQNLIETVDIVSIFDNEALSNVCQENYQQSTFENFNKLIAESLIQTTSSFRFPGQLNGSMKKLALNCTPFPRMHFFQPNYMPLLTKDWEISQILSKKYKLCSFEEDLKKKFLTIQLQFRGNNFEMPESQNLQINKTDLFKLPGLDLYQRVHTSTQHRDFNQVVGFLGNSGGLKNYMNIYSQQLASLYRRKAFLHTYTGVGIDEFEFVEAESNLNDLISEYAPYDHSCCMVDDYDEGEEEEAY